MNPSRWIALLVVGLYAAACLWLPIGIDGTGQTQQQTSIAGKALGLIPLVLGFVCVWWSEVLGDALWMGRGAWNPKPSSGGAVSILGWIFLAAAMVLCLAGHRLIPAVMGTP
jgi:hypothetical protein